MDSAVVAELRLRLAGGDICCLNDHQVCHLEDPTHGRARWWIACGGEPIAEELFAYHTPQTVLRGWAEWAMDKHRASVAEALVAELLDEADRHAEKAAGR